MLPNIFATTVLVSLVVYGVTNQDVGEDEELEEEEVPTTVPRHLWKYTHGIVWEHQGSNKSTKYWEPEFKRFCNDCEDYWHNKCMHYPHIYDDSKGCVLKTLSPQSAAALDQESDDEYDTDESGTYTNEYEEDEEEEEEEEEEKAGHSKEDKAEGQDGAAPEQRKKPEVLMKAADVEAMREKLSKIKEQDPHGGTNQKEVEKAIANEMQNRFSHVFRHDPETTTINEMELETVAFSSENAERVTFLKEVYDDGEGLVDHRVNNAMMSCPREFAISQSKIPDLMLGVWSRCDIPKGVVFGPFRGQVDFTASPEATDEEKKVPSDHILKMYHPNTRVLLYQVDGRSNALGNWCRYINGARHISEQNCEVFFVEGEPYPYFRTTKDVKAHTEMLAFYGNEYRKGKYTSLLNVQYNVPLNKPLPVRKFLCSKCDIDQGSPLQIQTHRKLCNATRVKGKGGKKKEKKKKGGEDEDTGGGMNSWENRPQLTTMDKEEYERLKAKQRAKF